MPGSPISSMRWGAPNSAPRGLGQPLGPAHRARHQAQPPTSPAGHRKNLSATSSPASSPTSRDAWSPPACRPTCAAPSGRRSWTSGSSPASPPTSSSAMSCWCSWGCSACRCRAPGGGASGRRRRQAEYAGRAGYWAARIIAGAAFLLLFLPLTAPVSAPYNLARQIYEVVMTPVRWWRWLAGRRTRAATAS